MTRNVANFNDRLTPRETTVLDHIISGSRNKEMARSLGISPRTIETHRQHIRAKLGARTTADMVRIALSMKRPAS